jgi:prevent-host-death family protein
MKRAGIAELKARLSSYIEQVKGGNEVLVTDRGMPVAKLVPVPPEHDLSEREQRLIRAGLLIAGRGRVRAELRRPPRGDPRIGAGVLAALLEEREEGR